jgi:hypothetical protein
MDSSESSLDSINSNDVEGSDVSDSGEEYTSGSSSSEEEEMVMPKTLKKKQYDSFGYFAFYHLRLFLTPRIPLGDDSSESDEATAYLEAKALQLKHKREREEEDAMAEDEEAREAARHEGVEEEYIWRPPTEKQLKKEGTQGDCVYS